MPGVGIAGPDRASLGENSRMLVGGDTGSSNGGAWISFVTGNAAATGPRLDVTDNMSGGFTVPSRGPRSCTITADIVWRAEDNPLTFPPTFAEGELTDRIILWPDYLNDPASYFKLPGGFCEGYAVTVQGTADVRASLNLSNDGEFFTPSRPDPDGVYA